MKKIFTVIAAIAFSSTLMLAQTARQLIASNPERAANIYHRYETFGTSDTPAPEGYVPFYISHYGRHGSRYHSGQSFFNKPIHFLDSLDKADALNETGKRLLKDIRAYAAVHNGVEGILTQTGSREHREIAERMYKRFPEVFNQKGRKDIFAVSSIFPRCLQSMSNFTGELRSFAPDLRVNMYTGDRYMAYIANSVPFTRENAILNNARDSVAMKLINPERMMRMICKNYPDNNISLKDKVLFIFNLYYVGAIRQDIEVPLPDIFCTYFDLDDLMGCWEADEVRMYGGFGETTEIGSFRSTGVGIPLLKDFVSKADEVLAGKTRKCADLRFGHDTGLAPLLFLINAEGCKDGKSINDASKNWWCFREMCMGSNIQMVFFKNADGDILVKILHNERETTLEGAKTFSGPYYKWSDLREFFLSKIEN